MIYYRSDIMVGATYWHLGETLWYFCPPYHEVFPNARMSSLDVPDTMTLFPGESTHQSSISGSLLVWPEVPQNCHLGIGFLHRGWDSPPPPPVSWSIVGKYPQNQGSSTTGGNLTSLGTNKQKRKSMIVVHAHWKQIMPKVNIGWTTSR